MIWRWPLQETLNIPARSVEHIGKFTTFSKKSRAQWFAILCVLDLYIVPIDKLPWRDAEIFRAGI
jgi:hypothetical protein